jgi:hypothetical protein
MDLTFKAYSTSGRIQDGTEKVETKVHSQCRFFKARLCATSMECNMNGWVGRLRRGGRSCWHKVVALNEGRYQAGVPRLTYGDAAGLDRAYTNLFAGRAEPPTFRKKLLDDSFRFPQGFKADRSGLQESPSFRAGRMSRLSCFLASDVLNLLFEQPKLYLVNPGCIFDHLPVHPHS